MVKITPRFKEQAKKAKKLGYKGYYITTGGKFNNRCIKRSNSFEVALTSYHACNGTWFTPKEEVELRKTHIQYKDLMRLE